MHTVRGNPPLYSSKNAPEYGDPNLPVVKWIRSLPNTKDELAIESLIQALNDGDRIGRIDFHLILYQLYQLYLDPNNLIPPSKPDAAKALGIIGGERAVEPLIQVLEDEDGWVLLRVEAAEALGKIGDERAVEPLIQVFNNEDSWILQDEAAEALEKIKAKKAGYNNTPI